MAKAYLYKIKNIRTGEYLPGAYKSNQVKEICSTRHDISTYAKQGYAVNGTWKIEFADEGEKVMQEEPNTIEIRWCREWDKTRMKILKACGKA